MNRLLNLPLILLVIGEVTGVSGFMMMMIAFPEPKEFLFLIGVLCASFALGVILAFIIVDSAVSKELNRKASEKMARG